MRAQDDLACLNKKKAERAGTPAIGLDRWIDITARLNGIGQAGEFIGFVEFDPLFSGVCSQRSNALNLGVLERLMSADSSVTSE